MRCSDSMSSRRARRAARRGSRTGSRSDAARAARRASRASARAVAGVADAAEIGVEVEHRGTVREAWTRASSRSRGREAKRPACIIRGRRKRRCYAGSECSLPCFVAVTGPAPALAHHSVALYDTDNLATVKGVVTKIEWTSPHVFVYFAADENGASRRVVDGARPPRAPAALRLVEGDRQRRRRDHAAPARPLARARRRCAARSSSSRTARSCACGRASDRSLSLRMRFIYHAQLIVLALISAELLSRRRRRRPAFPARRRRVRRPRSCASRSAPAAIDPGQAVTLRWEALNAFSLSISPRRSARSRRAAAARSHRPRRRLTRSR